MTIERDTQRLVGKILQDGEGERDAIHVPVLPAVCGEDNDWGIHHGQRVKLAYGTTNVALHAQGPEYGDPGIGIADPFLEGYVKKGERFLIFLRPGTITGLRHQWHHPDVDNFRPPADESEAWLRAFAQRWNFDYDDLIAEATAKSKGEFDHYITARGVDLHSAGDLGPDHDVFWHHLERLTGRSFGDAHRRKFGWSCSC